MDGSYLQNLCKLGITGQVFYYNTEILEGTDHPQLQNRQSNTGYLCVSCRAFDPWIIEQLLNGLDFLIFSQ